MPLASHLPLAAHAHRHTRHRRLSRDFAFSLAAEPSRHGPQQQCSDIHCSSLTLSAPGKERRARALVESHSLTCGVVSTLDAYLFPVRTRSRGSPSGRQNVSDLANERTHKKSKAVLFEQARDEREAKAPLPLVLPLNLHRHLPRRTAQPVVGGRR